MHEMEKKLDATIARKILDIQDNASKIPPVKRTMRLFISNLAANQFYDAQDSSMDVEGSASIDSLQDKIPCWTLKIEGKLLDVFYFDSLY